MTQSYLINVKIVSCVPLVLIVLLTGCRSQYFSPYYSGVGVYPASTFPLQQFPYPALSLYPNGNQNLDQGPGIISNEKYSVRGSYQPISVRQHQQLGGTPFRVAAILSARPVTSLISNIFQNSKLSPLLSNFLTRTNPNTPGFGSGVIVV